MYTTRIMAHEHENTSTTESVLKLDTSDNAVTTTEAQPEASSLKCDE
jgi:hypothetical protein